MAEKKSSVKKNYTAKSPEYSYGSGYGKRPMWQWVLIYIVIGGIVYGLVYYAFFAKKGYSYNYGSVTPDQATQQGSGYQY